MSIEETNGFSVPNEDANVAGADSVESAPADQTAHTPENNETAPGANNEAPASSVETRPGAVVKGEDPYALVFSAATGASSFQKSSSSGFRPIEEALKCGSRPALRWAT